MATVQTAMWRMPFYDAARCDFTHPTVSEGLVFCSVESNAVRVDDTIKRWNTEH